MSPAARALVLTAGLGTRLRPLTYVRAKAAVPVNGEPLARRVLRWLARSGIREHVLNLHHHPASIAASSATAPTSACASAIPGSSRCSARPAGRAMRCRCSPTDGADDFLIVNGDTLTDVDLEAMRRADTGSRARSSRWR